MTNLLKLASLAGLCFGMIALGACGGGSGGARGAYTVTVNGTAYSASGTASGGLNYTVTNGLTYVATGTDTNWQVCTTCSVASSSTSTSTIGN
jgi:hypothetical protein